MQAMKLHLGLWKSWIHNNQRVLGRRLHKKIIKKNLLSFNIEQIGVQIPI